MRTQRCIENHRTLCLVALVGAVLLGTGCVGGPPGSTRLSESLDAATRSAPYGTAARKPPEPATELDSSQGLTSGTDQYRALCQRGYKMVALGCQVTPGTSHWEELFNGVALICVLMLLRRRS